jgi:RNA polymerase sigma-70 factor (ECF subfamily)
VVAEAPSPYSCQVCRSIAFVVTSAGDLPIAATAEVPFSDEVAAGVRLGDPEALTAVYEALVEPLTSYLRSQVRDRGVATDLAQETFIELVRACRGLTGGPREIRSWVYRAAQRNVIDHIRYKNRRPEDLIAEAPERPLTEKGPDELALDADEARRIQSAMARLSEDQAQVIALRFLAGLSAPEVAAVMDRNEGAVRALQHRAVAALARILRAQAVSEQAATTPDSFVRLRRVEVR